MDISINEIMPRVKAMVEKSGLNYAQLGAATGIPSASIKQVLEDGKNPSFVGLCKLIVALGGSVDDVIGNSSAASDARDHHVRFVEHEMGIQRKEKHWWQGAFIAIVLILLILLIIDLSLKNIGWFVK